MIGGKFPLSHVSNGVVRVIGKWPGSASPANGLYTPTKRPDGGVTWKGFTLTRTGTGLYTVQWVGPSNVSSSVPYIGMSRGDVISSTNRYDPIWIKTEVASTGTFTIAITLAGTATDPAAAELIRFEADVVNAGQP